MIRTLNVFVLFISAALFGSIATALITKIIPSYLLAAYGVGLIFFLGMVINAMVYLRK